MKNPIKYITLALLGASSLTSCLEETYPASSFTAYQLGDDIAGLSEGVAGYLVRATGYGDGGDCSDIGFAQMLIWRDTNTGDYPSCDVTYDYYTWFASDSYLGNYVVQTNIWVKYYYLIQKCNAVMLSADAQDKGHYAYLGNAFAYRAMAYLEMAQCYEYKACGIEELDAQAEADELYGITVPIVTEYTTSTEGRNNPRAPFYTLYRFINQDLSEAENYLADVIVAHSKNTMSLGCVYGLQARMWMALGSRFEKHPEDLASMIAHEEDADIPYAKLGVTSAKECFANAATAARNAINLGYMPLSESQWFDPLSGFNTPNNSWLLGIIISTSNDIVQLEWQSWASYMSVEANWGTSAAPSYNAYRMIDARLFDKIDKNDWRRTTWIAPGEQKSQSAFMAKYQRGTSLSYEEWSNYKPYTAFKFHPANGDRSTYANGNAVSIPLMRIEEMFLIEAEAVAHSQGAGAGLALLESFMNTYRMQPGTTYTVADPSIEGVCDAILLQKRIELWGEGIVYWDERRLEVPITKGYPGTNHPESCRYNSLPDHVAAWSTWYIPDSERNLNVGCKLNPDPTNVLTPWSE